MFPDTLTFVRAGEPHDDGTSSEMLTHDARVGVMQVTDSLDPGGMERVAVNVGNLLPRARYRSYLCATRTEGALAELVAADVERLRLERRARFDVRGFRRLVQFVAEHRIDILHAHGTSLFIATAAAFFPPYPRVIWHDHCGAFDSRSTWLYRAACRRVRGVIAVNRPMAEWCRTALAVPRDRVSYVPNFVCRPSDPAPVPVLPGIPGARIVCTANLRPQKDHLTLLRALASLSRDHPQSHLLLLGSTSDRTYDATLRRETERLGLTERVSFLGHRADVDAVLRASDIGVLSSVSEGFPLALIEYGLAGLPAVATSIGQCPEVLDGGRAGLLVPPSDPLQLASALSLLLRSAERRAELGQRFRRRVETLYSGERVIEQICEVYDAVVDPGSVGAR